MKVYAVVAEWDYEGYDIISVHRSAEGAQAACEKSTMGERRKVVEYDVLDTTAPVTTPHNHDLDPLAGRRAYEAYYRKAYEPFHHLIQTTPWDKLPEGIRDAWTAAAVAAVETYSEHLLKGGSE